MHSVYISTTPFGQANRRPVELLERLGVPYRKNDLGRRLTSDELVERLEDSTILIAGTEKIDAKVLRSAKNLKLIARVGVGLDSVDLNSARELGIKVSYTPEAPADAVAELAFGMMFDLLRGVTRADRDLRRGEWKRHFGKRLGECVVGVVGVGRIGSRLIRHLLGAFPEIQILANDIRHIEAFDGEKRVRWADKVELFTQADLVTLHVPLTPVTNRMVKASLLNLMKPTAFLINTSRGQVIAENDLAEALRKGTIAGAALDVFENEPYRGPLCELANCILTCHMGSMTADCRSRMEIEATEEACRFVRGEPLFQEVPESEYRLQQI